MDPSFGFVRSFVRNPFLLVSSIGRTGERGLGYHSVICYMCGDKVKESKKQKQTKLTQFFHACVWHVSNNDDDSSQRPRMIFWQGHRLGSTSDPRTLPQPPPPQEKSTQQGNDRDTKDPPPRRVDPGLTESGRERQREERLAAVEKRNKRHQTRTKKVQQQQQPLKGPNTAPLLRWNAWRL